MALIWASGLYGLNNSVHLPIDLAPFSVNCRLARILFPQRRSLPSIPLESAHEGSSRLHRSAPVGNQKLTTLQSCIKQHSGIQKPTGSRDYPDPAIYLRANDSIVTLSILSVSKQSVRFSLYKTNTPCTINFHLTTLQFVPVLGTPDGFYMIRLVHMPKLNYQETPPAKELHPQKKLLSYKS